jgi:hypothetical protein
MHAWCIVYALLARLGVANFQQSLQAALVLLLAENSGR